MRDDKRRAEARKRAEGYAPKPLSSVFMYGFVGACLAGLAWVAFTNVYDLDPFAYVAWRRASSGVRRIDGSARCPWPQACRRASS
jgi:hypothetical protein